MRAERGGRKSQAVPLPSVETDTLVRMLDDIAGAQNFGPQGEWTEWLRYLLPELLVRGAATTGALDTEVLAETLRAFMSVHFDRSAPAPYPQFWSDALATLGQAVTSEDFWHPLRTVRASREGFSLSSSFFASMMFCLKFLPPEALPGWMGSVIAVDEPAFRAQVIAWCVQAHRAVETRGESRQTSRPYWSDEPVIPPWADGLRVSLKPTEGVLREVAAQVNAETALSWIDALADVPDPSGAFAGIQDAFLQILASREVGRSFSGG